MSSFFSGDEFDVLVVGDAVDGHCFVVDYGIILREQDHCGQR